MRAFTIVVAVIFMAELQDPSEIFVSVIVVFVATEGTVTIASPPKV